MKRDVKIEAFYPHPVERVWRALTDREAMALWLMPNNFEPRPGHRFHFRTKPAPGFDGIVHCEVLEVVERERLSFTWKGGPVDTIVAFTLEPVANGTRLRLEHTGFEGVRGVMISFILGGGWKKKILPKSLPAVLALMSEGEMKSAAP